MHVIGPELGLTQPGMTIACGDSHTSTHGAFGAIAFGIGTSQVRDVLASQCLALEPLKVRRIDVNGRLRPRRLREGRDPRRSSAGSACRAASASPTSTAATTIDAMTMDERMTICNMSIEGGARVGYVNPDETTFDVPARAGRSRRRATRSTAPSRGGERWRPTRTRAYDDARDDRRGGDRADGHLGHQPGPVGRRSTSRLPADADDEALAFMGFTRGQPRAGHEDRRRVHRLVHQRPAVGSRGGRAHRPRPPRRAAREGAGRARLAGGARAPPKREGSHEVFIEAGFEWRGAGCSMCLAMNPDQLEGRQVCASSSNRNFKGRQGSPTGRTLLMSPAMVAAAAVAGEVVDVRELLDGGARVGR